jgi:hypothetical protein
MAQPGSQGGNPPEDVEVDGDEGFTAIFNDTIARFLLTMTPFRP